MTVYLLLALGLIILLFGGKILVDGASSIALKLGMSTGLIGLTVVAFGTSAPELLVSLTAALKGNREKKRPLIPSTKPIFAWLEPTTFPVAIMPSEFEGIWRF